MAFIIAPSLLCTISEMVLPLQPMAFRLRLATGVSSSVGSPVSGSRTHWEGGGGRGGGGEGRGGVIYKECKCPMNGQLRIIVCLE